MTAWLGVEPDSRLSPRAMQKGVHAAVAANSFERAARDLRELAELDVSPCRLRRLVERIGGERVTQLQRQAAAYRELPLPARRRSPASSTPELACVQCDGGRMQILDRQSPESQSASHWRETKAATLHKMRGATYAADPCPTLPTVFADAARMRRLSREIQGFSGDQAPEPDAACVPEAAPDEPPEGADEAWESSDALHARTRPRPVLRSVVASTGGIEEFGGMAAAAAHARGFHAAPRKAFVGDGMACNWTLHERWFSHYTPILDFVHALCHVHHAAMAGRDGPPGWAAYRDWAQWLWSGQIDRLLAAVEQRLEELGSPAPDEPETSPRRCLAATRTYLRNQRSRMDYPRYRQEGLPITSAYIESAIKQLNQRVKGTEKFWSVNAAPMVQLRADYLSETEPLQAFWRHRPQTLPATNCYHLSG